MDLTTIYELLRAAPSRLLSILGGVEGLATVCSTILLAMILWEIRRRR